MKTSLGTNELRHSTEGARRENSNRQGDKREHQPRRRDRRQTGKQREERGRVCMCVCAHVCLHQCHPRVAGHEFVFWSSQFPSGNGSEGDATIRPHQPQGRRRIVFHSTHAFSSFTTLSTYTKTDWPLTLSARLTEFGSLPKVLPCCSRESVDTSLTKFCITYMKLV